MITIINKNISLIAMDLDGTLTQHKSRLESNNRKALDCLSRQYELLIVGAGSCERIFRQMECYPISIIGYYGMQRSNVKAGNLVTVENTIVEVDKQGVIDRIELLRTEVGLKTYSGESVEFHDSGLFTFPLLGTLAPIEQKLEYDPDRKKRRSYYDRVSEVFNDYTVFIGGSSSFDIVPRPYNKLYAIDAFLKQKQLERDQVIYIGDDYGLGGNDEHVYLSDIKFICIDDYSEFPKIAESLL